MKHVKLLVLLLLLTSCAATGLPSQEVVAETVGDIETTNTVINESGMSLYELGALILLAGWAIPSPLEMFGGIGRFVLKLFGRL